MQAHKPILLVPKRTEWERAMRVYASEKRLCEIYQNQKEAYEAMLRAHGRQKANLEKIRDALGKLGLRLGKYSELPMLAKEDHDMLISFGGDNHFIYVSRFAGSKAVLGMNSDPQSSTGALLYFQPENFMRDFYSPLSQKLASSQRLRDCLQTEQWTCIEGEMQNPDSSLKKTIRPCMSEISVSNAFHNHISRFLIRKNQEDWEEIQCSGLLLATGAGSSGWYRNAHVFGEDAVFPKEAPFFRALAREAHYSKRRQLRYLNPEIHDGERLEVLSQMEGEICLDADAKQVLPFKPGSHASFFLSKNKLLVVNGVIA